MRKTIIPLAICFTISYTSYALIGLINTGVFDPRPTVLSAREMQIQAAAAHLSFVRWQIFWFAVVGIFALGGLAAILFIFVLIKRRAELIYPDRQSGLWPVIRQAGWTHALSGGVTESDPNLATQPHRLVRGARSLVVQSDSGGVTPDEQLRFAQRLINVQENVANRMEGRRPPSPNRAQLQDRAGVFEAQRQLAAAQTARVLASTRPASTPEPTPKPAPILVPLTLAEALRRGADTPGQLEVGQAPTGQVAYWRAENMCSAIFGAPGTGKTSNLGFTLALGMLSWGWDLIVFEPADKTDWRDTFGQYVSHHAITGENLPDHLDRLEGEIARRTEIIQRTGSQDYRSTNLPPVCWIMEEYGATREEVWATGSGARARDERLALFDSRVENLVRKARSRGLFIVFCDQYPKDYPRIVRRAISWQAVYRIGGANTSAVNSPQNHQLRSRGQFDLGERDDEGKPVFFNSWLVVDRSRGLNQAQPWLTKLPVRQPLQLEAAAQPLTGTSVSGMDRQIAQSVDVPESVKIAYDAGGGWEPVVKAYLVLYPSARLSDLARVAATLRGDVTTYVNYKSVLHPILKTLRTPPVEETETIPAGVSAVEYFAGRHPIGVANA